jgi:hypothetical protein
VIELHAGRRRVRCASCGRTNSVPAYVHVSCDRCGRAQRRRFRRRFSKSLCVACGNELPVGDVELLPLRRRVRRRSHSRRMTARESVAFALLLYAAVFLAFLMWLTRQ